MLCRENTKTEIHNYDKRYPSDRLRFIVWDPSNYISVSPQCLNASTLVYKPIITFLCYYDRCRCVVDDATHKSTHTLTNITRRTSARWMGSLRIIRSIYVCATPPPPPITCPKYHFPSIRCSLYPFAHIPFSPDASTSASMTFRIIVAFKTRSAFGANCYWQQVCMCVCVRKWVGMWTFKCY